MNLFKSVFETISLGDLKGPQFIKKDSDANNQLQQLELLLVKAPESVKPQISQDIKMLEYGIFGEETVAFELNNSHIPMLILHDLHLVFGDLSAQIDYLIITNRFILVLECKNLFGNIEINNSGDFIRTMQYFGKYKKEGIYSPITQNTRHCDLLRKIWSSGKENFILRRFAENQFDYLYRSIVVLANPKTVINMKYAKKEIKEKIIRADQLNSYIRRLLDQGDFLSVTKDEMLKRAEFILGYHQPNRTDYTKKYMITDKTEVQTLDSLPTISERQESIKVIEPLVSENPIKASEIKPSTELAFEDSEVYKSLKAYRLEKSRQESIKAYYVYNNAQMVDLIKRNPQNIDELVKINGFDSIKANKYGNDIIEILKTTNQPENDKQ